MKKRKEFPRKVKKLVLERSNNHCERCKVDFDEDFKGEFHHIKPLVFGEENDIDNCQLFCKNCHSLAPNVKNDLDLIIYNNLFLKFSSYKEAFEYYDVNTRLELFQKIAQEISEKD
jgi:hypothetical protein